MNPTKLLIIGPSWVGDMVMAQSLFMTLKRQHPNCQIDVLAPAWALAILARMPEVSRTFALPLLHGQFGLLQRYQLGRKLRTEHYDQAIVLPNSWKSALIPFFANIPKRTGYRGEYRWGLLNDIRILNKQQLPMTVQRFVALAAPKKVSSSPHYPIPVIMPDSNQQSVTVEKYQLTINAKIIALCPGAEYGEAKRWPTDYFATVAKNKLADGWHVWLLGSHKDWAIAEQINHATGNQCTNLAGRTSLSEVVDIMALVHAVVSNDSGLMHIAAALDKRLIALYGSSDPGFTPPLNKKATIIFLHLECAPCFKRQCPLYPPGHPKHTRCLNEIKPDQVLDILATLH